MADSTTLVNVLGLQWDTVTDKLHFIPKMILPQNHTTIVITKRQVLQQSSRVFDPLGYLAPVTVQAKLFLKKLWQHKISWDDTTRTVSCQDEMGKELSTSSVQKRDIQSHVHLPKKQTIDIAATVTSFP